MHSLLPPLSPPQFVLDCRPFYVAGFNVDNIAQAANPKIARKIAGTQGCANRGAREAAGMCHPA